PHARVCTSVLRLLELQFARPSRWHVLVANESSQRLPRLRIESRRLSACPCGGSAAGVSFGRGDARRQFRSLSLASRLNGNQPRSHTKRDRHSRRGIVQRGGSFFRAPYGLGRCCSPRGGSALARRAFGRSRLSSCRLHADLPAVRAVVVLGVVAAVVAVRARM